MAKVIPIFKAESLLIPIKFLNAEDIESAHSRFTYFFYNEKACKTCENLPNRHNEDCDGCQQFKGSKRTSKVVTKEGNDFLSMPAGGSKKVKKWLIGRGYEKYKLIDRMPDDVPLSSPIKMIKKTWDYQTEAIQVLLEKRRGILESPPRTGKTVMGAAVICKVGQRAIIIAHQLEWLLNFQETFIGSDTQEKFTNCKSTQIKICKTLNDFQTTDICLTTFSKFMSKAGKKLLAQIRETFGVCIVDECHQTPALETSRVLSRINARYLFGLSGTVERKVTEEIKIATDLIGPVIHKCEVERLRPKVVTFFTNEKIADPKGNYQAGFTYFQARLENNTARRAKVITQILKYARAGHLVLVPLTRVNSVLNWTREINYEAEQPGFALPFYGGLKKDFRKMVIEKARNYECRVVVGNIRLLSTGLNIPRASCMVESTATSNIPKCDQRVSRILTPMEGKPQPVILLVLDDSDLLRKCRQNEWWNCIEPRFDPIIYSEDKQALMDYFAASSKRGYSRGNLRDGLE